MESNLATPADMERHAHAPASVLGAYASEAVLEQQRLERKAAPLSFMGVALADFVGNLLTGVVAVLVYLALR